MATGLTIVQPARVREILHEMRNTFVAYGPPSNGNVCVSHLTCTEKGIITIDQPSIEVLSQGAIWSRLN